MDTLDIAYITSIVIILLGGAFCIAFFGSKEKTKRDNLSNSFRFVKRNGEILRAPGKPSLFERKNSYYYIEKAPFASDVSVDGIKGTDGKSYKAIAMFTLFIPDDSAQTAAESFFGLTTEEIGEMLAEPLEEALKKVLLDYDGSADNKSLAASFRENGNAAVAQFGVTLIKIDDIRVKQEA